MSEHPAIAARWAVSSRDWQSHAIDEDADGVSVARCGQQLARGATRYDEPPGWMCLSCLRSTERPGTGEVTEPAPEHADGEAG